MDTIITTKKVKCDNCGNYIRQPKYHKEMIGICCFKCFNMAKHKYYEIVIYKYFNKIKLLEEEIIKYKKKLNISLPPRMPEPKLYEKKGWKDCKSNINYSEDGNVIVDFN